MAIRTIAPFLAYEADGGGTGVPLLAKGTPGTILVAAEDSTQTGIVATAYRLSDGAEFVPMANHHGAVEGFRVDIPDESPGIWFMSGPVASYRPTVEGSRGERGLPGPDAIENDETVGTYMATAGTRTRSETKVLVGTEVDNILDGRTAAILTNEGSEAFQSIAQHFTTKNELVFNVRDFGATGNGVADDAPAIQAALNAAGGVGTVLFPPGHYGIMARIQLPANTTISGYGATIHRLPDLGGMFINWVVGDTTTGGYDGRSNITIMGLTFDAHGETATKNLNILTFGHARNIIVRDCTLRRNRGYHSIEMNAIDGALVENCRFEGFVPDATLLSKEAVQIDCASPGDFGLADNTMSRNITVRGCTFTGYAGLAAPHVAVGSHTRPTGGYYDNITVENCTATATQSRMINAYYWRNSTVSNCHTTGAQTQGFRAQGCLNLSFTACTTTGATAHGIILTDGSTRCRVTACSAENTNEGGYDAGTNNVWSGNTFRRTTSYGLVAVDSSGTLFTGNLIEGAGYTGGAWAAIRISGTATKTGITGNKVIPHGAGTEVSAGVSVAATSTDSWVFGNDFRGLASAITGTTNTTSNRI